LWLDPIRYHPGPEHRYAIQTANGTYLTASGGGGRTSDAIHSDATQVRRWEEFGLAPTARQRWDVNLVVASGNYLTAVGGGGKTANALHTDATQAQSWEQFRLAKIGDLGSGSSYFMLPSSFGTPLYAVGGGGRTVDTLGIIGLGPDVNLNWAIFVLLRQSNGSYVLRTLNGNYLTADRGGGLAQGAGDGDTLQTNRTQPQAWEQFTFIEQNNGTYVIQTVSGGYVGMGYPSPATNVTDIQKAERFTLLMTGF
jgi:hypothetical protein